MNPPTILQSLRGLPRPVWILFAGTFLNKFGTFVIPFLSLYLIGRGFSVKEAGIAMGAYGLGHFAASFIGGHLADRFGRRPTIVLSMFSTAVLMLCFLLVTNFWSIVVVAALAGLTGELYRPASAALLTDLTSPGERVRVFAAYRIAFNAGWAFGPATAGLLAKYSFTWLFIGDAITSALFGIIALVGLPEGVQSDKKEAGWKEAFEVMRLDRQFQRVLFATLLIAIVFFQMVSTLGLHMTTIGFSAWTYGIIISLNGVMVVLCELPLTSISQRVGFERTMVVGYLLTGIGFGAIGLMSSLAGIIVCMIIFTFGEMLTAPLAVAQIADLAPANMRGRYMGAFGFTWASALTFAPILGGMLFEAHPAALWVTCAFLAFAAACVMARRPSLSRESKRLADFA